MQIGILEGKNFSAKAISFLSEKGHVQIFSGTKLEDFLRPLEVLFIRLAHKINYEFLEMAPNLRYICSPTTGHTHMDVEAIQKRGIILLSLRNDREFLNSIRATSEHTFGLIIALLRKYQTVFKETSNDFWDRDRHRGYELYGNSVGIIGLGRIGFRVASYCSFFGAKVSWFDIKNVVNESHWVRQDSLDSLVESSKIIILCASHEKGQSVIMHEEIIMKMTGRYFINTSRGELVDEVALINAIKKGQLCGCATDVIVNENGNNNLRKWRALAKSENVIITPHMGGATSESMAKTEIFLVEKFLKLLNSKYENS
jgi:D-3-phosphoglycerate dehydrogenase